MRMRAPTADELPAASELCLRSKAVWGYDQEFMEACRPELTLDREELCTTQLAVAEEGGRIVGVVQVGVTGDEADLLKLFVEPACLRSGVGRLLFDWAIQQARLSGATQMIIEADPEAVAFYRRMGACEIGLAPSGSIPGRQLPKLAYDL